MQVDNWLPVPWIWSLARTPLCHSEVAWLLLSVPNDSAQVQGGQLVPRAGEDR